MNLCMLNRTTNRLNTVLNGASTAQRAKLVAPNSIYDEIERRQLDRREIAITGMVDADMAHVLAIKLRYLASINKRPITIYMNTPGGSISDGFAVYDEIMAVRQQGVKINIVAVGNCMSMGTIIMQAATNRLAQEHAAFLLHELSMVNIGSLGQQKDLHGQALRLQNMLNDILTKRSGLSPKDLTRLIERKDMYLSAKEAKKFRLIDKVV